VGALSELFYADAVLRGGARLDVPPAYEERALFVAEGAIQVDGETFSAGRLLVLRPRQQVIVGAPGAARVLLLGGATMDGPRHIWWNLVSSSPERIEQAKVDWAAGRFPKVPGETELIPLPGHDAPLPKYP
jgi:redox-sensitive bicupin YhaK (pirin superfamily)